MLKRRGLLRVTNGGSRALKGLPQVPNMRILRYIFRSLSKLAGATGRRQRARATFRLQGRFLNPHVPGRFYSLRFPLVKTPEKES